MKYLVWSTALACCLAGATLDGPEWRLAAAMLGPMFFVWGAVLDTKDDIRRVEGLVREIVVKQAKDREAHP